MKHRSSVWLAGVLLVCGAATSASASDNCEVVDYGDVVEETCVYESESEEIVATAEQSAPAPAAPRLRRWGFYIGAGPAIGTLFTSDVGLHYGGVLSAAIGLGTVRLDGRLTITGRPGDGLRVAADTGAAFLFIDGALAPYMGAGIGIEHQTVELRNPLTGLSGEHETTGFAGYVSAGLEMLRTTTHRILVEAKLTLPAFETGSGAAERWVPGLQGSVAFLW